MGRSTARICNDVGALYTERGVNRNFCGLPVAGMIVALNFMPKERLPMLRKLGRLFVIKTRWEAFLIIYAIALGAVERGSIYLRQYPGWGGKMLFLACTGAVFMAGAKILDCLKLEQERSKADQSPQGPA